MKLIKLIKDIISPKKCYSCNKEWHFLCKNCFKKIYKYKPYCYICKNINNNFIIHKFCKNKFYLDKIIVLTRYKDKIIKKLLQDAKFYWKKDIFEDFAIYLSKLLQENEKIQRKRNYIIIPIPMYFLKKVFKGYNQTDILAKNIWDILQIKVKYNVIKKIKNTRQQSKLTKKERIINLQNAFKINKKQIDNIDNKKVILIDDIVSTGTTLNEVAKTLKENWIKNIIWLAIASD